jgi:molybdopterin converting factor small subunit
MPTFQIHYFSTASSYTGKSTERLPAPLPLSQLFNLLEERYPGIQEKVLGSCSVAVGDEYVDVDVDGSVDEGEGVNGGKGNRRVILEEEEVAIIPPVSSG